MHCINLFEESVRFQEIYENATRSNITEEEIRSINKTYTQLKLMMGSSGCNQQICTTLEEKMPSAEPDGRDGFKPISESTYKRLKAMKDISCGGIRKKRPLLFKF